MEADIFFDQTSIILLRWAGLRTEFRSYVNANSTIPWTIGQASQQNIAVRK